MSSSHSLPEGGIGSDAKVGHSQYHLHLTIIVLFWKTLETNLIVIKNY